jgi:hypothetical protein
MSHGPHVGFQRTLHIKFSTYEDKINKIMRFLSDRDRDGLLNILAKPKWCNALLSISLALVSHPMIGQGVIPSNAAAGCIDCIRLMLHSQSSATAASKSTGFVVSPRFALRWEKLTALEWQMPLDARFQADVHGAACIKGAPRRMNGTRVVSLSACVDLSRSSEMTRMARPTV